MTDTHEFEEEGYAALCEEKARNGFRSIVSLPGVTELAHLSRVLFASEPHPL